MGNNVICMRCRTSVWPTEHNKICTLHELRLYEAMENGVGEIREVAELMLAELVANRG